MIGDSAADSIAQLYEEYEDALIRYALRLTHDRDWAEDLVQDTFVRAMGHLELLKMLKQHTQVTLDCVECLKNAIECIDKSEGVKESIYKCREGEHNADIIERDAFQLLYKSGHEAKDLILLSKLIELMGQISNYAEDASDTLSLILLMHRP